MVRSWPFVEFRHAGIYLSLVAWYRLVGVNGRGDRGVEWFMGVDSRSSWPLNKPQRAATLGAIDDTRQVSADHSR